METLIARVYAAYKANGIPTHDKNGVSLIGRHLQRLDANELLALAEYWEEKAALPTTLAQLGSAIRRITGFNGPNTTRGRVFAHALAYNGPAGPWRADA